MVNRAKQRGTSFETAVVNYCRDHGFPYARRLALAGGADTGDITLGDEPAGGPVTIEAKDHAKLDLAGFVDEAITEAANAGTPLGVAVVKRRGKNVSQAYVVTTLEAWLRDRQRGNEHG